MKNLGFFLGIIITCIIGLLLLSCQNAVSKEDYTKTPVVFIHGYGLKADYWETIIKTLIQDGYPDSYLLAIELIPNSGSNIWAAEKRIAPEIEKLTQTINEFLSKERPNIALKTKVDMVSHSMGALSARWYTSIIKPERVRHWIALAGAHHGTDALCGYRTDGADDLCPAFAKSRWKSKIQYKLNGKPDTADIDETPYGVGNDAPGTNTKPPQDKKKIYYWSIRTSPDRWIVPEKSAILDGAGGHVVSIPKKWPIRETTPGNFLMNNKVGHDPMVANEDVIRLVKLLLSIEDQ